MEGIRLLHFADLHIGIEAGGRMDPKTGINMRVMDFLNRLDEAIDIAIERADVAIFAGDAFKSRRPSPTYQRAFAQRIRRLTDAGIPILMITGNHDLPVMTTKASTLDIYNALGVENVIICRKPNLHVLQTRRGPMQVIAVPYPVRQHLMARKEYQGMSVVELDAAVSKLLGIIVQDLIGQLDTDIPAVVTAHVTVEGSVWSSERSVMVGTDIALHQAIFTGPAVDYVALGHIHRHQSVHEEGTYPAIVYSGSMERIDFGEEKHAKGVCLVNLIRRHTTWEFVELAARDLVTIAVDVREAEDPLAEIQAAAEGLDLTDAIVRLVLEIRESQKVQVPDRLVRPLLAGAHRVASVGRKVQHEARIRLGTTSPEELPDPQLMAAYFRAKGIEGERADRLLAMAAKFMEPDYVPKPDAEAVA